MILLNKQCVYMGCQGAEVQILSYSQKFSNATSGLWLPFMSAIWKNLHRTAILVSTQNAVCQHTMNMRLVQYLTFDRFTLVSYQSRSQQPRKSAAYGECNQQRAALLRSGPVSIIAYP